MSHVALETSLPIYIMSVLLCWLVVWYAPKLKRLGGRTHDLKSVQSAHKRMTPRVGGLGIFAALILSVFFVPETVRAPYIQFLLASAVLFGAGLAEDLGWHVSPKGRLLAATVASLLVVVALQAWVPRIGWSVLDPLMVSGVLGIPITIFVVVGISNAFNLIDGVNGLSGTTALICAIALGAIATKASYAEMSVLITFFAFAVAGFLVVNYPFGKIFLGDAGAYTIGFILAWYAVAIAMNHPDVTPWALLLTMFWPIADTFLAIYRRGFGQKPAMQPDRLHVHQLVMRGIEIGWLGRDRRAISNPMTTLVLTPFIALPAALGVMLWNQPALAFFAFFGLLAAFFGLYFGLAFLVRIGRIKRVRSKDFDASLNQPVG